MGPAVSEDTVAQSRPIHSYSIGDNINDNAIFGEKPRSDTSVEQKLQNNDKNVKSDSGKILRKDSVTKVDYPAATKASVILSNEFGIKMSQALKSRGTAMELDTDGEDDDDDDEDGIPTEFEEVNIDN
jgi:hypothetical protein